MSIVTSRDLLSEPAPYTGGVDECYGSHQSVEHKYEKNIFKSLLLYFIFIFQ